MNYKQMIEKISEMLKNKTQSAEYILNSVEELIHTPKIVKTKTLTNAQVVRLVLNQTNTPTTFNILADAYLAIKVPKSKDPKARAIQIIKYFERKWRNETKNTPKQLYPANHSKTAEKKVKAPKTPKPKKLSKKAQVELLINQKADMFIEMFPAKNISKQEVIEMINEHIPEYKFQLSHKEMTLEQFKNVCEGFKEKYHRQTIMTTISPNTSLVCCIG